MIKHGSIFVSDTDIRDFLYLHLNALLTLCRLTNLINTEVREEGRCCESYRRGCVQRIMQMHQYTDSGEFGYSMEFWSL